MIAELKISVENDIPPEQIIAPDASLRGWNVQ